MRTTITTVVLAAAVALAGCSQGDQGEPEGDQAGPTTTVPAPSTTTRSAGNPSPNRSVSRSRSTWSWSGRRPSSPSPWPARSSAGSRATTFPTNRDTAEPAYRLPAPEGTRFCQVDLQVLNSGKRMIQFSPGGYLYDTEDRQYAHDEDATVALEDSFPSNVYPGVNTMGLRPGQQGRTAVVFPIQTGAAPAYLELTELGVVEDINGERHEARVNVAPGDVRWQHPRGQ